MTGPALPPWRLVAMTFEAQAGGRWVLVVRHEFYGATREQAIGIFHAHMQADAFLRGCTEGGRFDGIVCRTETTLEHYTP